MLEKTCQKITHHHLPEVGSEYLPRSCKEEVSEGKVDKPKPFDVICSGNSITSVTNANHVGNNRFQVILDMRIRDFEASSQEKRNRQGYCQYHHG